MQVEAAGALRSAVGLTRLESKPPQPLWSRFSVFTLLPSGSLVVSLHN